MHALAHLGATCSQTCTPTSAFTDWWRDPSRELSPPQSPELVYHELRKGIVHPAFSPQLVHQAGVLLGSSSPPRSATALAPVMELTIETTRSETFLAKNVARNASVGDLKQLIRSIKGIPTTDTVRLSWDGVSLDDDDSTLLAMGITEWEHCTLLVNHPSAAAFPSPSCVLMLGDEAAACILSTLSSPQAICAAACVCKQWRRISRVTSDSASRRAQRVISKQRDRWLAWVSSDPRSGMGTYQLMLKASVPHSEDLLYVSHHRMLPWVLIGPASTSEGTDSSNAPLLEPPPSPSQEQMPPCAWLRDCQEVRHQRRLARGIAAWAAQLPPSKSDERVGLSAEALLAVRARINVTLFCTVDARAEFDGPGTYEYDSEDDLAGAATPPVPPHSGGDMQLSLCMATLRDVDGGEWELRVMHAVTFINERDQCTIRAYMRRIGTRPLHEKLSSVSDDPQGWRALLCWDEGSGTTRRSSGWRKGAGARGAHNRTDGAAQGVCLHALQMLELRRALGFGAGCDFGAIVRLLLLCGGVPPLACWQRDPEGEWTVAYGSEELFWCPADGESSTGSAGLRAAQLQRSELRAAQAAQEEWQRAMSGAARSSPLESPLCEHLLRLDGGQARFHQRALETAALVDSADIALLQARLQSATAEVEAAQAAIEVADAAKVRAQEMEDPDALHMALHGQGVALRRSIAALEAKASAQGALNRAQELAPGRQLLQVLATARQDADDGSNGDCLVS